MKTKTESLSIRLESEIAAKLEKLATDAGKSRTQYVRELLHVAAANDWQISYHIKTTE